MRRVRSSIAVGLVCVLVLAACSDDKKTTTSSASSAAPAALTASFRGVTATTIKIGVAVVDFECIKDFVDFNQGDSEKIIKALVDDLNANGGILGRKLEIVFKSLCPLQPDSVTTACTSFTDDEQVFAVIGIYDTPPSDGSNQLCLTRDKETILITELIKGSVMEEAPPGFLLMPGILPERQLEALISVLKKEGTLKGKVVATLTDQDTQAATEKAVGDALKDLGATAGSNAVLTITNEDTAAAQAQLDSFIEKWKTEKVNVLFMGGLLVSAKQFVEKIRAAIPDMLLITDDSSVGGQAQDEVRAGKTPNPYEGMLTLFSYSDVEQFNLPGIQKCVKAYEAATGETVVSPDKLQPGPDGKRAEVYVGIMDRCGELAILKAGAEKAGPELTNDSWVAAINSLGTFSMPTTEIASLSEGKYDAEDGFRLGKWDSSLGVDGGFAPQGELQDVTK